ncbi:MAG: hypothetical protein KQI35_07800 [Bacteroidetes bacterium]|nr:hypothetical protein [Bacteroidota bacterium]
MKKAMLTTAISLVFSITLTMASKPIANIQFYDNYNYLEQVTYVENNGVLDGRVMPFLMDENTPIDQKAAVINAFTVNNKIKNNAMTMKQFLARKYGENFQTLNLEKLTADELFCYGYLTLMDEGGDPDKALPVLEMAVTKNPSSQTIATIHALVAAQEALDNNDQCGAWLTYEKVQNNANLTNDMDDGISSAINERMKDYEGACN